MLESLQKVSKIVRVFDKYRLGWMTRSLQIYGPDIVREFYANYAITLKNMTPPERDKDIKKHPRLDMIMVWEKKS